MNIKSLFSPFFSFFFDVLARLLFSYDDNWRSMQVLQLYFLIEQIWLTLCQLQNPRDKSKKNGTMMKNIRLRGNQILIVPTSG